jgi:hypothetical protein
MSHLQHIAHARPARNARSRARMLASGKFLPHPIVIAITVRFERFDRPEITLDATQ